MTLLRNYCLISAARFFPKTSSVTGYFLLTFLSKIRFFFDFSRSSLSHAVTFGILVFWDGSSKIKQASSSYFLGGGLTGTGLWVWPECCDVLWWVWEGIWLVCWGGRMFFGGGGRLICAGGGGKFIWAGGGGGRFMCAGGGGGRLIEGGGGGRLIEGVTLGLGFEGGGGSWDVLNEGGGGRGRPNDGGGGGGGKGNPKPGGGGGGGKGSPRLGIIGGGGGRGRDPGDWIVFILVVFDYGPLANCF